MISAGFEGRIPPYMTYPEPWRGPPKQPPEFLRPAPKPIPPTRYNGVNAAPNGTPRVPTAIRPKYQQQLPPPQPPSTTTSPVNLTHKDDLIEELPYASHYRLYPNPPPPSFTHFPMYQNYPHLMRSTFPHASLQALDAGGYPSPTTITSPMFLAPANFSPPVKMPAVVPEQGFKVPSGKEGSMKHRILVTRTDEPPSSPLDLHQKEMQRKRLTPPDSPTRRKINNNNTPGNFNKGSLIQLANGELRRIEDMRTEDFIGSAESSAELRLVDSTIVRIEEHVTTGTVVLTLSYNQRRNQVEIESLSEHPFFVFGQGWASCNPERTQQCYHLKVHRLQVGDIVISLTPREKKPQQQQQQQHQQQQQQHPSLFSQLRHASAGQAVRTTSTTITTATHTAMTSRPLISNAHASLKRTYTERDEADNDRLGNSRPESHNSRDQPMNLQTVSHAHYPHRPMSPDSLIAAKKRRWSAPDQFSDDDTHHPPITRLRH